MALRDNNPNNLVRAHYSNPQIVRSYTTVGLFPSEEIVIDRFFEPEGTVLDIGCGAGRTTIALAKKGYKVTGIDIIPEMIESAKVQALHYREDVIFKVMDATDMKYPGESFHNVLFSFNGFEQIAGKENREKTLSDIFRILKSGGCFVFTVRSGIALGRRSVGWVWMSLTYLWQRLRSRGEKPYEFGDKIWKGEYHHYMSPFYIRRIVSDIGFKILYFNSDNNILKDKHPGILTNFTNDKMLFFVLRK